MVSRERIHPSGRKRCRAAPKNPKIPKNPKKLKTQEITLSEQLRTNMTRWNADIRSFLHADCTTEYSRALICPIAAFYEDLSRAEIRNSGDAIRLRFLKVLFHQLKDRFCATYLRSDAVEWIAERVIAAELDDGDSGRITNNIKEWAYVGGRYESLSRDLGNSNAAQDYKYLGSLFRLPDDITDR